HPPGGNSRRPGMKSAMGVACAFVIALAACGGEEGNSELQKEKGAGEELSSSCAGIMPSAATGSWTHLYTVDSDSGCGLDTSDGSGNVMLERLIGPGDISDFETDLWDIFTTVGHARGSVNQVNGTKIFPQEWGFMTLGGQKGCSVTQSVCDPDFALRAWTANGALIRRTVPSFEVWDSQ